jgi:surface polysaccharide O-acyltransferase-like enzyme
VVLAVLLVAFGPFLWLPLYLALAAWRSAPDDGLWRVAAPLLAFLGVLGLQALLAIQKSRYVRTPAVVLPALAWSAGLYLGFTTPGHVWGELPEWRAPGTAGWIVIAAGTVLYTGLFLFLLQRLDRKRWVKRLQVFR